MENVIECICVAVVVVVIVVVVVVVVVVIAIVVVVVVVGNECPFLRRVLTKAETAHAHLSSSDR